ncbi:hypothetical protein G6M50_06300 [Agrobacterium rhizogenes]|nr:hypothetical protein [Rhizobium rhizogenes]NTJ77414.1 hypothetical protein [Rhizobium rhizogenes]
MVEATQKIELIDAVHQIRDEIASSCRRVESIAMLLEEVGMDKLSERLWDAVQDLPKCSQRLNNAFSDKLSEDLHHSETIAGSLLLLALKSATGERS